MRAHFVSALIVAAAAAPFSSTGCTSTSPVECTDANVELIQASNYDQSCKVDSDCVNIAAGNACYPCAVNCPSGGAINRNALARYENDISKTIGFQQKDTVACNCPAIFNPCCLGGVCQTFQCQSPPPSPDAATDANADVGADALSGPAMCVAAGGRCLLGGSTCSRPGPQDCNPDRNPGGAYCCLDAVDSGADAATDAFADASASDAADAAGE